MPQRTLTRVFSTLGAAALLLLGAGAGEARAQNPTATFTPIEPLGTDTNTTVLKVSGDGELVTGQSIKGTTTTPYVWLWQNGGAATAFTGTSNFTTILPTGVSNNSTAYLVVGNCNSNGTTLPFYYDGTTFNTLTLQAGNQLARATGVSDVSIGQVAVNGANSSNVTLLTGYSYKIGVGVSTLGFGGVYGVSSDGENYPYLDPATGRAAIYENLTGAMVVAPNLTGNFSYSEIDDVSKGGLYIVGVATGNNTTGQNIREGYLFNVGSTTTSLLKPFKPGDVFAVCWTVSDATDRGGPIGGGFSGIIKNFPDETAVLYDTSTGTTVDLKELLISGAYDLTVAGGGNLDNPATGERWLLHEVHGISADGSVIVGDGTYFASANATGVNKGFVVQLSAPPEDAQNVTIINKPADQTINIGGTATFVVVAVPGLTANGTEDKLSYQWAKNGANITNQISNTLTVTNQVANATYSVFVSNSTMALPAVSAHLAVIGTQPGILINNKAVSNLTLKSGAKFSLNSTVDKGTDGSILHYQWALNGANISSATGANYTVAKASSTSAGNYTVIVNTSNYGNLTSKIAKIVVQYAPTITTQPTSMTVAPGTTVSLVVVATGVPTPAYQWYIHNMAMARTAAKRATFTIPEAHIPDSGQYRVRIMNSMGTIYSNTVQLTVSTNATSGGGNTSGNTSGNSTGG